MATAGSNSLSSYAADMRGDGDTVDDISITGVIAGLRALLTAIDDGRVEATDTEHIHLADAVEAWEAVSRRRRDAGAADTTPLPLPRPSLRVAAGGDAIRKFWPAGCRV